MASCSGRFVFAALLVVLWSDVAATRHLGPHLKWKPRQPRTRPLSATQLERTVSLVRSRGAVILSRAIDDRDAASMKEVYALDFYKAVNTTDGSTRAARLPIELSAEFMAMLNREPKLIASIATTALGSDAMLCETSALVVGVNHKHNTDLWDHINRTAADSQELFVLLPLHDFGTTGNVSNNKFGAWEHHHDEHPTQWEQARTQQRQPARLVSRPGDAIIALSQASLHRLPNTSKIAVVTIVFRFVRNHEACAVVLKAATR